MREAYWEYEEYKKKWMSDVKGVDAAKEQSEQYIYIRKEAQAGQSREAERA